ncbi:MAG: hypothetical protein ACK56I_11305, partial [bacterium]
MIVGHHIAVSRDDEAGADAHAAARGFVLATLTGHAVAELRKLLEELIHLPLGQARHLGGRILALGGSVGELNLDADNGRHHPVDEVSEARRGVDRRGVQLVLGDSGGRGQNRNGG